MRDNISWVMNVVVVLNERTRDEPAMVLFKQLKKVQLSTFLEPRGSSHLPYVCCSRRSHLKTDSFMPRYRVECTWVHEYHNEVCSILQTTEVNTVSPICTCCRDSRRDGDELCCFGRIENIGFAGNQELRSFHDVYLQQAVDAWTNRFAEVHNATRLRWKQEAKRNAGRDHYRSKVIQSHDPITPRQKSSRVEPLTAA